MNINLNNPSLRRLCVLGAFAAALAYGFRPAFAEGAATLSAMIDTPKSGGVTLSWWAPSENVDGSAIDNLAGYIIYYGQSPAAMTNVIAIDNVGIQTYVIDKLSPGSWFFSVVAINTSGIQSGPTVTVRADL